MSDNLTDVTHVHEMSIIYNYKIEYSISDLRRGLKLDILEKDGGKWHKSIFYQYMKANISVFSNLFLFFCIRIMYCIGENAVFAKRSLD